MKHLVLLGDSIFDNGGYVPGGPAVVEQVRELLPRDWKVSLLARDGAMVEDVADQLARLPPDATHLVVSAGGNDALFHGGDATRERVSSVGEALARLSQVQSQFRAHYQSMLHAVLTRELPTAVCTVYDAIPGLEPGDATGLAAFNDVIFREAFRCRLPVIDLRLVCADKIDYASSSPIEPSVIGGGKISRAIYRLLTRPESPASGTWVLTS